MDSVHEVNVVTYAEEALARMLKSGHSALKQYTRQPFGQVPLTRDQRDREFLLYEDRDLEAIVRKRGWAGLQQFMDKRGI